MPSETSDAKIRWDAGVPVSTVFDDPYYSRQDGLAEARHVFLDGNRLTDRFAGTSVFTIAELGFGTGLNFLAALALWRRLAASGGVLRYVSFEKYPMDADEMDRALAAWPDLDGLRAEMLSAWTGQGAVLPGAELSVLIGDARQQVPQWGGQSEAWFLDGFAPARNPEMWEADLLAGVYAATAPGGTMATYSAAGAVRRGLQQAGFSVAKVKGFGRKREMLTGFRP